MKTSSLGIALLASVAVGCNDAAGPGLAEPADLVGQWIANAYTVTSVANASQTAELVGDGFTLTITFTETTYAGIASYPGEPAEDFSGTYTIVGQSLILDEVGQDLPETMAYVLSSNVLTLSGTDEHSFVNDGPEEAVTFVLVLDKQ